MRILLAITLICAVSESRAGNPPQFGVTDIGSLGGLESESLDLNDLGDVVGRIKTNEDHWLPFVFRDGKLDVLGAEAGITAGAATAINNAGLVVGYTNGLGFVEEGGALKFVNEWLDELVGLGWTTRITDLNDAGLCVGYLGGRSLYALTSFLPTLRPYRSTSLWCFSNLPSSLSLLYLFPDSVHPNSTNTANAVNNLGTIVGDYHGAYFNGAYFSFSGAFSYKSGVMTKLANMWTARGINDNGQIVGCTLSASPALHEGGVTKDLAAAAGTWYFGTARSISATGDVLITSEHPSCPANCLFTGGKIYALASLIRAGSGLTLVDVAKINAAGQIAATAVDAQGKKHAVLLTPESWPDQAPIPEPVSLALPPKVRPLRLSQRPPPFQRPRPPQRQAIRLCWKSSSARAGRFPRTHPTAESPVAPPSAWIASTGQSARNLERLVCAPA